MTGGSDVTHILQAAAQGDRTAAGKLLPLVYEELRKLAAQRLEREKPGQTLQATALVHEGYLRLVGGDVPQRFSGRGHFFAAAAEAMRRILVDNARHKQSLKGGGDRGRVELDGLELAAGGPPTDVLALDEALEKLARDHPRKAKLVKLRFFAGLTNDEAAEAWAFPPPPSITTARTRGAGCASNSVTGATARPARDRGPATSRRLQKISWAFPAPIPHGWRSGGSSLPTGRTMADQPSDEEALFHAARRLPSPGERADYLRAACGDNPALLGRVEELLRA